MRSPIRIRRDALVVLSVLAIMMALLAVAPASAHGTECGEYVHKHNGVWTVYPNGSNDTEALECALEEASEYAVSATPTVRLAEGTFYVDFLKVDGFRGRLKGAGRDATTIEPLEGGLDCVPEFEATGFVVWMVFTHSDLIVKDLSIEIPEQACREPYFEDVFFDPEAGTDVGVRAQDFGFIIGSVSRTPEPTDQCGITARGGLTVKRVDVVAPAPDFEAPIFEPKGAFSAFRIAGTLPAGCSDFDDLVGSVHIKHVHTNGVGNLVEVVSMEDSRVTVKHNRVTDFDTGIVVAHNERTKARVVHNRLNGGAGAGLIADNCVFADAGPVCTDDATKVRFLHNDITMLPGAGIGVGVFDGPFDELVFPALIDAKIRRNAISVTEAFASVLMFGNDGTLVHGNDVEGSAVFGVLIDGQEIAAFKGTNSRIIRNDFSDLLTFEAGVLLGELTANNVVKGNKGVTVVDLGMDNVVANNTPGPALRSPMGAQPYAPAPSTYAGHWTR